MDYWYLFVEGLLFIFGVMVVVGFGIEVLFIVSFGVMAV